MSIPLGRVWLVYFAGGLENLTPDQFIIRPLLSSKNSIMSYHWLLQDGKALNYASWKSNVDLYLIFVTSFRPELALENLW